MTLSELKKIEKIDLVRIHSLESSLYQLSVVIDGEEDYVTSDQGSFVTSHNKLALQSLFKNKLVGKMVLSHQSAYDEMVGLPDKQENALEVPIGNKEFSN